MFGIENRRYIGNKCKLMPWIRDLIVAECPRCVSLFDVFAGTGCVSACLLNLYDNIIINDFLFSNEVIYKAFFGKGSYNQKKLQKIKETYLNIPATQLQKSNYVSDMFGNKFFSYNDAVKIGYIRQDIENLYLNKKINAKEHDILLASLLYSADHTANTVGHYDAFIKKSGLARPFEFDLISPIDTKNKKIKIYREDANKLAEHVCADIAFIDPPYNSRQYSRFYHVLETLTKWDKPKLYGVAMKPKEENMSDYCKTSAPRAFLDLIEKLKCKYIVVTYNNTYKSKSSSSINKITYEQIMQILSSKGKTQVFEKPYRFFNAGKTNFDNHKEYVFITKVEQ